MIEDIKWFFRESKTFVGYGVHMSKFEFWAKAPIKCIGFLKLQREDRRAVR